MFSISKWSLKAKIISLVVFACGLVTAAGLFAMNEFANNYQSRVTERASLDAKTLGDAIGAQFFERYGDIQAFALNPAVRELNTKVAPQLLQEYVNLYGIYDVILLVDKNGRFLATNKKDISGKDLDLEALKNFDYTKTQWFQSAIKGEWTEDKEKAYSGTFFESVHLDPVVKAAVGEARTATGFTTVVKNELGDVIGVLTNRANNKWFEVEFAAAYNAKKEAGFADAEITLTDSKGFVISNLAPKNHDGKIVFDTDTEEFLFKQNMGELHEQAGPLLLKKQSGAVRSFHKSTEGWDLVGFHHLDNPKWPKAIGWNIMVHMDWNDALAGVTDAKNYFYVFSVLALFAAICFSIFFGMVMSKSVANSTEILAKNSAQVSEASSQIASQATELSESATEQAAALQETVAAVDEISAMVEKNADAANKSKEVSGQSREAAMKGRETVEQMMNAIGEINNSNDEISLQMSESNRQLSDITKLINDIGSKTKVINEIVFQTKLLSFNASVEAARAGEYGKGFAVVAEEVGNLAQMSGNAAKEITEMLEQSVRQVETIVDDTKTKVERLMASSKQKVEMGSVTAKQCNEALEEILSNVSSVDSLVSEIAAASAEQSTGIREISKAVGQMEEVTQQNSTVAQQSSVSAEKLNSQSTTLNGIVNELVAIVSGAGKAFKAGSEPVAEEETGKVLPMRKPKAKPEYSAPMKKAAGDDFTPSSDDPGFGD